MEYVNIYPWERTPWWYWRSWLLRQIWRRIEDNHFIDPPEWRYATEQQVARDFLMEQFGGGKTLPLR